MRESQKEYLHTGADQSLRRKSNMERLELCDWTHLGAFTPLPLGCVS